MSIEEQVPEFVASIVDSWNSIRFEEKGGLWNLHGPAGESLTGIRFFSYERATGKNLPSVAAVDGSSVVILDAGSFLVGAVRVASVVYKSPLEAVEPAVSDTDVIFLSRENYEEIYTEEYTAAYGSQPPSVPDSFGDIVQRIRSMREMRTAVSALKSLKEGDILLTDGALKADVDTPDDFFKRLGKDARKRGVVLLGVSKKSGLSFGHFPLLALLRRQGSKLFPESEWACSLAGSSLKLEHQLGAVYLVRFSPLSSYVFRVDSYPEDALLPEHALLSALSLYCRDPAYLGYPFPLAQVHNASIIRMDDADAISHRIEEAAITGGISAEDWEAMFMDFHNVLDRGV